MCLSIQKRRPDRKSERNLLRTFIVKRPPLVESGLKGRSPRHEPGLSTRTHP